MIVIGIDPGLSGALAMVDRTGLVAVAELPIMDRGQGGGAVKHQLNAAALGRLLKEWIGGHDKAEFLMVVERQVPYSVPGRKQGSSSVFSMGHTAGIIEGVALARGISYTEVSPNIWKKALKIAAGAKGKEVARALAQRLYPDADLARKKDHNRAEAILIARYGYEQYA